MAKHEASSRLSVARRPEPMSRAIDPQPTECPSHSWQQSRTPRQPARSPPAADQTLHSACPVEQEDAQASSWSFPRIGRTRSTASTKNGPASTNEVAEENS